VVERLTSFVDGFASDDFLLGTQEALPGGSQGFSVAALFRLRQPWDPTFTSPFEFRTLLWQSGVPITGAGRTGWSLQSDDGNSDQMGVTFSIATDGFGGGKPLETLDWQNVPFSKPNDGSGYANRVVLVQGIYLPLDPDFTPDGGMHLVINGFDVAQVIVKGNYIPSDQPPRAGFDPLVASAWPPDQGLAGMAYEDTEDVNSRLASVQDIWKRCSDVGDMAQLQEAGSFQWDNLWSTRRGLPNIPAGAPGATVWTDQVGGALTLARSGGGDSMRVNAGKPQFR